MALRQRLPFNTPMQNQKSTVADNVAVRGG